MMGRPQTPPPIGEVLAEQRDLSAGKPHRRRAADAEEPGLIRLSKVTQREVSWLWQGYIPAGKITCIDGDPGVGKSSLALDIAARVSKGRPWPDGSSCRPGAVLILNAEEDVADTVLPRIRLAGGDPRKILVLEHIKDGDGQRLPSLPADVDYLTTLIKKHGVVLLIVDVLNSFLGGDTNTHRDADVRRALHPLHKMAVETGAAVLLLRHLNKTASVNNPMYRGMGSIGITGQARAVYIAAKSPDNDDLRVLAPVKLNVGPLPRPRAYQLIPDESGQWATVAWKGEAQQTAAELLAEPTSAEAREALDEASWWLKSYLEAQPERSAPRKEIFAAAGKVGIADRTLQRALREIGGIADRKGWAQGTSWRLPEEPS